MGTLVNPQVDIHEETASLSSQPTKPEISLAWGLLIAVWFGVFTGLVEGAGLLVFQRINWEQWGRIPHVSKEILWISPLVDVLVFVTLSLILAVVAWISRRNAVRVTVCVLAFLATFDLLALTQRLYYTGSVLLAIGAAVAFSRWWRWHRNEALRFWRKTFLWLLMAWLLVFAGIQGGKWLMEGHELANRPTPVAGTPNIILVVIDTLRADHISAYGYSRPTTPNLDRIAKQGVLFENAISACSWTFPSHASMLTGRYPSEHGMQGVDSMRLHGWHYASLRGYPTLGEVLETKGYRTGAFSANQVFFTSTVGLGKGFVHFEDYFQSPEDKFMRTFFGRDGLVKLTRAVLGVSGWMYSYKRAPEVNREMLRWTDQGAHPFFVVLNYIGVHEADSRPWARARPVWGHDDGVDRYDSALTYADAQIGVLLQDLNQRDLLRNTLVIITSDHGQSLGEHHLRGHGTALYLEQIHVPLIIWYPGHVPAGIRISRPVSNAAIAATIMNLVTGKPDPFPGSGLSPLWTENADGIRVPNPLSELARNELMSDSDKQAHGLVPTALDGDMKSILTPRWHLIEHQTLGKQLYDWVDDPGELNNLINTPEGQAVATRLEIEMQYDRSP